MEALLCLWPKPEVIPEQFRCMLCCSQAKLCKSHSFTRKWWYTACTLVWSHRCLYRIHNTILRVKFFSGSVPSDKTYSLQNGVFGQGRVIDICLQCFNNPDSFWWWADYSLNNVQCAISHCLVLIVTKVFWPCCSMLTSHMKARIQLWKDRRENPLQMCYI